MPLRQISWMAERRWEEIPHERREDYWEPFEARFQFRRGTRHGRWHAIREATPSVTLDLSPVVDRGQSEFAAGQQAVNAIALLAMTRATAVAERLLVLD